MHPCRSLNNPSSPAVGCTITDESLLLAFVCRYHHISICLRIINNCPTQLCIFFFSLPSIASGKILLSRSNPLVNIGGSAESELEGQATAAAPAVLAELQIVVAMTSKPPTPVGRSSYNGPNARRPAVQGLSKLLFLALAQITHVAAAPLKDYLGHSKHAHVKMHAEEEDPSLWLYLAVAAILVLLGGAFAGLTIA